MDTTIYALTDTHQESRNLSTLLSFIVKEQKKCNNDFIVLDGGDLFKGIYDKNLSLNAYLKLKEFCPNANIFLTLGNNDFGFGSEDLDFLMYTINKFKSVGINFVCANLKDSRTGEYVNFIQRYKIIFVNGRKVLITGFCLNTSIIKKFGYEFVNSSECLKDLLANIKDDYDSIIVLNHHWYSYSKELIEFANKNNIKIDLIIGGHEHSPIAPDYDNKIFYPLAFGRTIYKIKLEKNVSEVVQIPLEEIKILPEFEKPILEYENRTKLFEPIAKRVLNLYKWYSEPCALGTFISDNMMRVACSDIAFHSTGFTMYPLKTDVSDVITKYDFEKVICASTPIVTVELNAAQLKEIFENATLKRMYKDNGNSRFLQCSQNISIIGHGQNDDKSYKIIQIEINGEKLLDINQNPINPNKKYTCAIDSFIASGEQGYSLFKNIEKTPVCQNGMEVHLNTLLLDSLKIAQNKYAYPSEYPSFCLKDI
jgi:2',3'-cyclic-nucleotide 2'-phosphodiesterase (5'-nucleotidase family)